MHIIAKSITLMAIALLSWGYDIARLNAQERGSAITQVMSLEQTNRFPQMKLSTCKELPSIFHWGIK